MNIVDPNFSANSKTPLTLRKIVMKEIQTNVIIQFQYPISPIITLDKESYFFIELATSTIDKDSENEYTTIILFVEESCKWYFSFKLNQNYVVNHLKHAQIFGKELFTTTKYTEVGLRAELQPILSADNDDR